MNTSFDLTPPALLWLFLSLTMGWAAAHLAFDWTEHAPVEDAAGRWHRLLGAGLSLGTGVWSSHRLASAVDPVGTATAFHLATELMLWLLAVAASTGSLAWFGAHGAKSARWPQSALALGTAVVLLQMLAVRPDGRAPSIVWAAGPLLAAWLTGVVGSALALGLFHRFRLTQRCAAPWAAPGCGLLLAASLLTAQQCVNLAATLPAPTASDPLQPEPATGLTALALLAAGALLLGLRVVLRHRVRAHSAQVRQRRERATQSLNDPLTGLPSRSLFEGTLAQAVKHADAGQHRLALLLINLDGFRPVNHSFGQSGGDQLLREVAARLRALSQPHMTARLGGDEFVMLLTRNPHPEEASELAACLLASLGKPFEIGHGQASISGSIGVAMYPEHGAMSTLITHADTAMRTAKSAGGASHAFFEAQMMQGSRDQMALLADLRLALQRGQLELYYQPKIHAPSGEITGAEALMRWHHPKRGMVSPVVFIPIAERYGLIGTLGQWVIDEACRQTRVWRDGGLRMRVAINLSVHQLRQADLAERISAALQRHQVNPDLITCELTESSAMDDTEVTMRVLGELSRLGVHISIDDFGTGHSSLSLLRKLPAHELKIDRGFVLDLETSEDARKVASAVINLAKALNLQVVAEGVETEGQNSILREFGCDQLQGFLFARPMSAKALALWAMDDVGPRTMNFRDSLFKATVAAVA